jgi:TetR/AcrR family transcriptional repressor of nem operon
VGRSQAAKAESHDRILDIAAARIRRDGIDSLGVAELMKEAGLTHGGFYRHFNSREHLVAEAARRALSQGSEPTMAAGQLGGRRDSPISSTYTSAPGIEIIQSPAAA